MGRAGLNQWLRRRRDEREITGKRENKMEVGESRIKSVVIRRGRKGEKIKWTFTKKKILYILDQADGNSVPTVQRGV